MKTSSCRTQRIFRGVPCQKQLLPYRTQLQCAKRPPLSLFAPAHSTISFVPLTRNLSPAAPSSFGTGEWPLVYGRRFRRHSVQKTSLWCTEWKFGAKNRLLVYATRFSKARRTADSTTVNSLLPHRTQLQCTKQPPLSLFAPVPSTISFVPLTRNLSPAAPSLAPSTALGTRNGPARM